MTDDLKQQLTKAILDNADQPQQTNGTSQIIIGSNNFQLNRGAINISANQKTIKRVNRLPESDDINTQQKRFIQEKIYQLADHDIAKGAEIGKAHTSWWSRLKKKICVNLCTCLKQSQYDDVMKRPDQQVGMTRSKLRPTDKTAWRNGHYKGLYTKCRQLKKEKQWLYDQAFELTGKPITSLKDLNDTNLKKLYHIIFSRNKGTGLQKRAAGVP